MNKAEKLEFIQLMEEKDRRARTRKLFSYYPEKGPLRRELYPKHLAFFKAGASFRERLFLAANRIGKCVTGDTLIECPNGPAKRVDSIKGPHWVWAWDGKRKVPAIAEAPFVKPSERVYRVWLESGRSIDCAAEHRFLSEAGWLFLSDLFESVPCLPASNSEPGPLESLEDVQCYLRTHRDSPDDYRRAHHSSDARLRADLGIGQASVPSQGDVRKHSRLSSRLDALVDKCKRTYPRIYDRLSSLCGDPLNAGLFSGCLVSTLGTDAQSCLGLRQESLRPRDEEAGLFQQGRATEIRPSSSAPAFRTPEGKLETVLCYQPLDVQPIYDFHVPHYRNYCTQGFINHNTEGAGGYEMALHLTGLYPDWWTGRRFTRPIKCRASGDTAKTVRDILQEKMLGPITDLGTGLIPKDNIVKTTPKQGISGAVDVVFIKHKDGHVNRLQFKSFDQGRESFQGEEIDVDWLDEECPIDIYIECLLRTMTNDGMVICTFTPLMGLTELVMMFLPSGEITEGVSGTKFVITGTWDDVPHLSQRIKDELWAAIPPFQRDARSKGVPQLGAGAIYPVPESDFTVDPFEIPAHWPKCYGMDVGWNRTAVPWGAWDRDTDTVYLFSEHYRGEAEPSIHVESINSRGDWIPGVIDPASRGRSQVDGERLLQKYIDLGLDLDKAFNGVESGIYEVWQRLSTGRLKVFKSMSNWLFEFRLYRRDEKGKIVKSNDHLMDATRYLIMSGLDRAKVKPVEKKKSANYGGGGSSWMG